MLSVECQLFLVIDSLERKLKGLFCVIPYISELPFIHFKFGRCSSTFTTVELERFTSLKLRTQFQFHLEIVHDRPL